MIALWSLLAGVGLFVAMALADVHWHLVFAALAPIPLWFVDRDALKSLGRPSRWVFALVVLAAMGAWLGPSDRSLLGLRVSMAGALAGGTMITRSVAIVLTTSSLVRLWSHAELGRRIAGTRFSRIGEVLVVALSLVPAIGTALRVRGSALRQETAGRRWLGVRELAVTAVLEATDSAHRIAGEWNAARRKKRTEARGAEDEVPPLDPRDAPRQE